MSSPRILIVHHSKTIQRGFYLALMGSRLEADIVSNEEEVWPLVENVGYRMVLLSRQCIGEDLSGFVSRMRALPGYATTPLIMLLNSESSRQDEGLYQSGITRAFSLDKFSEIIQYIDADSSRLDTDYMSKQQVVLIEDSPTQQKAIKRILETISCEVICFASAEEALNNANQLSPKLIICDCFLEGNMTALDFVPAVRAPGHAWMTVPVLAMSGLNDMTRRHELIRCGANDFVAKPIHAEDLLVRVENLLRYKYLLEKVEHQSQQMKELAMKDALTGLYNRHYLNERVPQTIAAAQRHDIKVSVIVIDIDFFKKINDQHGHPVGDKVLVEVGKLLQDNTRTDDVVARIGGEEFVMLLSYCSVDQACQKAEQLRQKIEQLKPESLTVTASLGVSYLSEDLNDFEKIFKAADDAVYRAKNGGRNRVESALPIHKKAAG